jgi:hypothetical protein
MIVFPAKNCFTNAVDSAVSINSVVQYIIDTQFSEFSFKVGIGIDFGEVKVIKAGVQKQLKARTDYKGLVWIGDVANYASKLTDQANKTVVRDVIECSYHPSNPKAWRMLNPFGGFVAGNIKRDSSEPEYLSTIKSMVVSPDVFVKDIYFSELYKTMSLHSGKIISMKKTTRTYKAKNILMSKAVFEGFKKTNEDRDSIKKGFWTKQTLFDPIPIEVYGGDVHWKTIEKL